MKGIIQNAEPFYAINQKDRHLSFTAGLISIFLVTVLVSLGILGTLLYVNHSQADIKADQVVNPVASPKHAFSVFRSPLQPPAP